MKKEASRRKCHILYKTTCIVSKRFYIGMHSTDDKLDDYLGSGKVLRKSLKKYGKENHIREIIAEYPTRKELRAAEEKEISKYLNQKQCMNIHKGGNGPHESFNVSVSVKTRMSKAQLAVWKRPGEKERRGAKQKEVQNRPELKERLRKIQKERWQDPLVREKHRIAQENNLRNAEFRKKFKDICKKAHNTPEAIRNHSNAARKLTKEQAFAALDLNEATGAKRFRIANALHISPHPVHALLQGASCYKEWIDEWKMAKTCRTNINDNTTHVRNQDKLSHRT